jgi:CRISPR-associated protein Cas2
MLVIVVENAPPKLRGYLSSWALQIAAGVYVANLPARIRDEIWATVERWASRETTAVLLWATATTEQGLSVRVHGRPKRTVREIEGLLVSTWLPADASAGPSK